MSGLPLRLQAETLWLGKQIREDQRGNYTPKGSGESISYHPQILGAVFEASLLRTEGGFAYLKAADGTERKVPISALISADSTYISSLIPR
jgi:hypothetical protein